MLFLQVQLYCVFCADTLYSFPIEWISTIQSEELRIFQLGYLKSSTEVLKSLTIREDFSWVVSYKGETVNPLHCDLLKNIPLLLNSGIFSSCCTIRSVYIFCSVTCIKHCQCSACKQGLSGK